MYYLKIYSRVKDCNGKTAYVDAYFETFKELCEVAQNFTDTMHKVSIMLLDD